MTEIPDDIMKAANECVAQFRWNNDNRWHLFVARAIQAERERDGWQTMETAPKDGRFLAVVDGEVRVVSYGKTSHVPIEGFCLADQGPEDYDLCEPTAWQPLPAPPETEREAME